MSYKNFNETKGRAVVRFFVENFEKHEGGGQGVAGITCHKLWNMTDAEFDKLFNEYQGRHNA